MRVLLKFLGVLVGLAVALVVALLIYVQDANHLKPELQTLISERTGIDVTLGGDVSWQLWPPIQLTALDITALDQGRTITAQELRLAMDLGAFWQDMDKWRVDEFHLVNTKLTDGDQVVTVSQLDLTNFAPGEPAKLDLVGSVQASAEAASYPFDIKGTVIYSQPTNATTERLRFTDTTFASTGIRGTCDLDVRDNPRLPAEPIVSHPNDLLPIETLLSYEVLGDCMWSEVTLDGYAFKNVETKITNIGNSLNLYIQAPEFFAGSMISEVDVTLTPQPIRWQVMPELIDVDSKQLLEWRSNSLDWTALFATHSDINFSGNTLEALYSTIAADSRLDGQPGQIDITNLKRQLANIAIITRKGETVADWPDVWNYQEMIGNLQTRGQNQTFNFILDHLTIDGEGKVNYAAETMDMLANITIGPAPEDSPYRVNPILQDTPLPFRCRGPTTDVKCKLDENATKNLVARALRSDDDTGLRRKIEQKIDDEVPEEYREAAKGLLDILGRALEDND